MVDEILKIESYNASQLHNKNLFFDEVTIFRIVEGSATIIINQQPCELTEGGNFVLSEHSHIKIQRCSRDVKMLSCRLLNHLANQIYPLIEVKVIDIIFGEGGFVNTTGDNVAANISLDKLFDQHNNFQHPLRRGYIILLTMSYLFELYPEAYKLKQSEVVGATKYVNYSIDRFYSLCKAHHAKHHSTEFYADKLGISTRYLYQIVKSVTSQTPKQVITTYIMESAKRLLLATSHSVQEIAEELNFSDISSFGQFFKRNTGDSPTQFRQRYS